MPTYFATCPRNIERLLADELKQLGATDVERTVAGVSFAGTREVGYRAVLWSRLANAVLLQFKTVPAASPEQLYESIRTIDWQEHMDVDDTLKVTFTQVDAEITHTRYGAQKVKDAVVDQFRDKTGRRPSVELRTPDLHINCHAEGEEATVSIDLAGSSLHRRRYRQSGGDAPIKENVACAMLLRAGWPDIASEGRPLLDPMCGSGTLVIEAAMMAADQAPGLLRDYFGATGWKQHDEELWLDLMAEARERAREGRSRLPVIRGSDIDSNAIGTARANAKAAGLDEFVAFEQKPLSKVRPPAGPNWPGLLVANAPYGERLGENPEATAVHRTLGEVLKDRFGGWNASILTGSEELGRQIGMSADKTYTLYNGSLECLLLNVRVFRR